MYFIQNRKLTAFEIKKIIQDWYGKHSGLLQCTRFIEFSEKLALFQHYDVIKINTPSIYF